MKTIYIHLNEEGRVDMYQNQYSPHLVAIDVQENHGVLTSPFIYKYVDGELVKDQEYVDRIIEEKNEFESRPTTNEQVAGLTFQLMDVDISAQEAIKSNSDLMFLLLEKGVI